MHFDLMELKMPCAIFFEGTGVSASDATYFGILKTRIENLGDLDWEDYQFTKAIDEKHHAKNISGVGGTPWAAIWNWNWQVKVDTALEFIRKLRDKNQLQTGEVNLIGFSRGACNAIALAWRMQQDPNFSNLRINIFAHDPIPGGPNDFGATNFINLPINVQRYWTVLYEGSKSYGPDKPWTPVVPKGGRDRKVVYLPGYHLININSINTIIHDLLKRFFRKSHIHLALQENRELSLIEHYSQLLLSSYIYKEYQTKFRQSVLPKGGNKFRDHPFFINEEHYDLFFSEFPNISSILSRISSENLIPRDLPNSSGLDAELKNIFLETETLANTAEILFKRHFDFSSSRSNCRLFDLPHGYHYGDKSDEEFCSYYACDSIVATKPGLKEFSLRTLADAVRAHSNYKEDTTKIPKLFNAEEFKRVTYVRIGSRKEEVKAIDEMLQNYDKRYLTEYQKERLIVAIAIQLKNHIIKKPTSDRRIGIIEFSKLLIRNN